MNKYDWQNMLDDSGEDYYSCCDGLVYRLVVSQVDEDEWLAMLWSTTPIDPYWASTEEEAAGMVDAVFFDNKEEAMRWAEHEDTVEANR